MSDKKATRELSPLDQTIKEFLRILRKRGTY